MKERKKERSNKIPSNLPAGSLFTATTISRTPKRVRTLTLWLLHACVTRSQREINILRTRNNVLSAKTHYSHVHSVERIFSHATNVFKDSRRPGTDRVASSARSWKSYHVFIQVTHQTYSANHCNNSRNHCPRVHDHATSTIRRDFDRNRAIARVVERSSKCSRCLMSISSLEKPVNNNN